MYCFQMLHSPSRSAWGNILTLPLSPGFSIVTIISRVFPGYYASGCFVCQLNIGSHGKNASPVSEHSIQGQQGKGQLSALLSLHWPSGGQMIRKVDSVKTFPAKYYPYPVTNISSTLSYVHEGQHCAKLNSPL